LISFTHGGSLKNTEHFLRAMLKLDILGVLNANGRVGVAALASATPVDTGLAAGSWTYKAGKRGGGYFIEWLNTDVESGFPVSIMLQYGYSTGTGGYVAGRDYINPAIKPTFDKIAADVWKVVISS
jgi:hypothetical protein